MKFSHKFWLSVVIAFVVYQSFKPPKPNYLLPYFAARPVSVSSYSRSDGIYVSGHQRAMPGERQAANAANFQIGMFNDGLRSKYNKECNDLFFVSIGVF